MQGSADGTGRTTSDTTSVVTLRQDIVAAGAPHHFVPLMSGEPFGSLVPEQDLPVSIRHRHPSLQAV